MFILKAVVSVGVLAFVLSRADLSLLWDRVASASPSMLVLALLTPFAGYLITSVRWRGLLAAAGVRVPLGSLYRACMVAVFFNQFMPSTVGGDVSRVYAAWRAGASKPLAVSTLLVDRVTGILALVLLAAASVPFLTADTHSPVLIAVVLCLAAAVTAAVLTVFHPSSVPAKLALRIAAFGPGPISRILSKLISAFEPFRGRWLVLLRALGLSLLLQCNVVLAHYLLGRAVGIDISPTAYLFVIPVALVVMLIPVSINGIGVREGMFATLLAGYGVAETEAVALALLSYGLFLTHGLMSGVLFVFGRPNVGPDDMERSAVPTGAAA